MNGLLSLIFLIIMYPILIIGRLSFWVGILMIPMTLIGFFIDWEMRTLGKLLIGGILIILSSLLIEYLIGNRVEKSRNSLSESWGPTYDFMMEHNKISFVTISIILILIFVIINKFSIS